MVEVAPGKFEGRDGIHLQVNYENGATSTWSEPIHIQAEGRNPSLAKVQGGLALSWTDDKCFDDPFGYCNSDIWYRTGADSTTWSDPAKYTAYEGTDDRSAVARIPGGFALAWHSNRRRATTSPDWDMKFTVWFGEPAVHQDLNPPPAIVRLEHFGIPNPQVGEPVKIIARVAGDLSTSTVTSTLLHWEVNGAQQPDVVMEDRGGGFFRAELGTFEQPGTGVDYRVAADDMNGDRMVSFSRSFEVQPQVSKNNHVLLVVDDRRSGDVDHVAQFYSRALDDAGIGFDFWNTSAIGPPFLNDLMPYRDGAVIWSVPQYEPFLWRYWPNEDRPKMDIAAFLDEGGSLFISGQHISEHFQERDPDWVANYLGAAHVNCCAPNQVEGIAGDPIGDGLAFNLFGGDGANNSGGPDEIRPVGGAVPIFHYLDTPIGSPGAQVTTQSTAKQTTAEEVERSLLEGSSPVPAAQEPTAEPALHVSDGIAAVRRRAGQSKVVYFAFNFESISDAPIRAEVMARVMGWANPMCGGRPSTIDGTLGADNISGTHGDDVIVAFGGLNIVFGRAGNDVICGGPDQDIIHGGAGDDRIAGGAGDDRLNGGIGRDRIGGQEGEDLILGGADDDLINGGPDADQVAGGTGDDVIFGDLGPDLLLGGPGDDMIMGGPGDDTIKCGFGSDMADGGAGSDTANDFCQLQANIP